MTKIDFFTGLKGAGKTSLINRLLETSYQGCHCVVIQNELGKINLDTDILAYGEKDRIVMTGGCICCTMQANLIGEIRKITEEEKPDYILVEAAGMAQPEDIASICGYVSDVKLDMMVHVVDGSRFLVMSRGMGDLYSKPISASGSLYVNRLENLGGRERDLTLAEMRKMNPEGLFFTDPLQEMNMDSFLNQARAHMQSAGEAPAAKRHKKPVRIRI